MISPGKVQKAHSCGLILGPVSRFENIQKYKQTASGGTSVYTNKVSCPLPVILSSGSSLSGDGGSRGLRPRLHLPLGAGGRHHHPGDAQLPALRPAQLPVQHGVGGRGGDPGPLHHLHHPLLLLLLPPAPPVPPDHPAPAADQPGALPPARPPAAPGHHQPRPARGAGEESAGEAEGGGWPDCGPGGETVPGVWGEGRQTQLLRGTGLRLMQGILQKIC